MIGYYIGGAILTLFAGIFVVALNAKDTDERVLFSIGVVAASLFWPIAWLVMFVMGAAYKVKEMKEESNERRG